MASFRSQYGIRLSRELADMKWREFRAYVSGLDSTSPLGRIISIRAETDPERLKQFTPEMRKVRNKWLTRRARAKPQKDVDAFLSAMQDAFRSMAGLDYEQE